MHRLDVALPTGSFPPHASRPSRRPRRQLAVPIACAALGAVFVVEGAAGEELRHRLVAYTFGVVGAMPLALALCLGERGLLLVRKAGLSCAALLLSLVAVEVFARALDVRGLAPIAYELDPVLGRAHVPSRGAIDAWGYRNPAVPAHADIVCLGDSQTYGENLRRDQAYPARLGALTERAVYNMSLGGYGPLQMLALAERALDLGPETLVLGFYPGNDIVDAHRFAALEHWSFLRDPALEYEVPTELRPHEERSANLALALVDGAVARSWTLARLTHELKLFVKTTPALARAYGGGDRPEGYDGGTIRTLFSSDLRFAALDRTRPLVRDGLRITEHALRGIATNCAAHGVRLVLLVIPTKERVYHDLLVERGAPEARFVEQVAVAEADVTAQVVGIAREVGMAIADPTDALHANLAAGRAMWPHGRDGHLGVAGGECVATVLAEALAAR